MRGWLASHPYPRICVLKEVCAIQQELMGNFLVQTGKKFERKQKAKAKTGNMRTYVVILAFENEAMQTCFDRMFAAFNDDISLAIDTSDVTASLRLMRFRMLCSGMCAMHSLLRLPRRQLPYALFELISPGINPCDVARKLLNIPECMHDDLFKMILEQYPSEEDLVSDECLIVVEALAQQFAVDIAAIEAGHSTNRDFSLLRSKGWVPSLETVSARFNIQHFGHFGNQNQKPSSKKSSCVRKVKQRKGGGGSFRAYISHRARGQKGKANFRELAKEFKELPHEQKQRFHEIGTLGTLAHKKGYTAFGRIKRKKASKVLAKFKMNRMLAHQSVERNSILALPGDVSSTGAIVAVDADQSLVERFEQQIQKQHQQQHLQCMHESFAEKYLEFLDSLDGVSDPLALSPEEETSLQSLAEETQHDPVVKDFQERGHVHVADGMHLDPSSTGRATFLHWQPPAAHAAQARGSDTLQVRQPCIHRL